MNKDELNDYISNMSYDERMKLTRLYTETDIKVKDIITQENLPVLPGQFRKMLLPLPLDSKCKYCDVALVTYPSREKYSANDPFCPNCEHRPERYLCNCDNCRNVREQQLLAEQRKKEELAKIKKENIKEYWGKPHEPVAFEDLTFQQKVEVGALMIWSHCEDLSSIISSSEIDGNITPAGLNDAEIMLDLLSYGIINVDIESNLEVFSDDGRSISDISRARFYFNLELEGITLNDILMGSFRKNTNDVLDIWRKLYVLESIEYLLFRLNLAGLSFNPGQKTITVFSDISKDFSFGQCMQMIYSSYKTAMTKIQENSYTRRHAVNSIITMIDHYATNVRNGVWKCEGYNRDKRISYSALGLYFYDKVLGLGDRAYELPVREESLNGE